VIFLSGSRCRAPVAAPAGGGYRPALLSAVSGCRLALLVTSGGSRHALTVAAAEQRLRRRSRAIRWQRARRAEDACHGEAYTASTATRGTMRLRCRLDGTSKTGRRVIKAYDAAYPATVLLEELGRAVALSFRSLPAASAARPGPPGGLARPAGGLAKHRAGLAKCLFRA
jgi:hypothetical protein